MPARPIWLEIACNSFDTLYIQLIFHWLWRQLVHILFCLFFILPFQLKSYDGGLQILLIIENLKLWVKKFRVIFHLIQKIRWFSTNRKVRSRQNSRCRVWHVRCLPYAVWRYLCIQIIVHNKYTFLCWLDLSQSWSVLRHLRTLLWMEGNNAVSWDVLECNYEGKMDKFHLLFFRQLVQTKTLKKTRFCPYDKAIIFYYFCA